MTISRLEPGQSKRRHRHKYETIVCVTSGENYPLLGEERVRWHVDDAFFVPVWAWYHHINTSRTENAFCEACKNAPMPQKLGITLRAEV